VIEDLVNNGLAEVIGILRPLIKGRSPILNNKRMPRIARGDGARNMNSNAEIRVNGIGAAGSRCLKEAAFHPPADYTPPQGWVLIALQKRLLSATSRVEFDYVWAPFEVCRNGHSE